MNLSEKNIEIISWFRRQNYPVLGELYEGAIRILSEENFPGFIQFVAHSVREIKNRLPDLILGEEHVYFDWKKEIINLEKCWIRADVAIVEVTESENLAEYTIPVPYELCKRIEELFNKYAESNETYRNRIFRLFSVATNIRNSEYIMRPVVLRWIEVTDWFVTIVHVRSELLQVDNNNLNKKFLEFENMLHALQGNVFQGTKDLDEILAETNRTTDK